MIVHFVLDGVPRGKQRPRVANGHAYTPIETRRYERALQDAYIEQARFYFGDTTRVQMRVIAWYMIPKSTPKTMRAMMLNGDIRPIAKPDLDNVLKAISDSLNGLAFSDDKQINAMMIEKRYTETPRVEVWLTDEGLQAIDV